MNRETQSKILMKSGSEAKIGPFCKVNNVPDDSHFFIGNKLGFLHLHGATLIARSRQFISLEQAFTVLTQSPGPQHHQLNQCSWVLRVILSLAQEQSSNMIE